MAVTWRSLELEGFGRYRDGVRVDFGSGLNTVVADNEAGKSTLVAGLTAVLFGLPRGGSVEEFGAARFQNWDRPGRFAGAVEFDAGGHQYRLRRDFTDNRILLEIYEMSGERRVLVQGEHNPQARKRNERYEEVISALLGVASRELFWRTFCITQPLPEARRLDNSVQRLLSGAGGDLKAALRRLFDRLRDITKNNSEFGVEMTGGRNDKVLEQERGRVVSVEKMIRESAGALDRLYVENAELAGAEERRRATQAALQEKEAAAAAFAEWRRLRDLYALEVRQKTEIEQALEAFQARQKAYDALASEIDREYKPFAGAGVGERLAELANLEARLSERDAQVTGAQEQIAALEAESQALETDLRDNYVAVRGRQHIVIQVRALRQLSAELADVQRQLRASATDGREAQEVLASMPAYGTLGDSPVQALSYVKTQAADFQKAWNRASAIAATLESVRPRIRREYSAFENAEPRALDALSRYDTRVERLEREVERRQGELDRARTLLEDHTADEARVRQEFSDVWDLGTGFAEAAETKIALLRESFAILRGGAGEPLERREAEPREAESLPLARRIAATLLFGIGGFVIAWSLLGSPSSGPAVIVSAAVAVIGAILGWGVGAAWRGSHGSAAGGLASRGPAPGRLASRVPVGTAVEYSARLAVIQQELAGLDATLGDQSSADQAVLAALLERIRARDAGRKELEAATRSLPPSQAVSTLASRLDAARKEMAEFRTLTKSFADRFGDIAGALAAWHALKAEERGLTSQLDQALSALGLPGLDPASDWAGRPGNQTDRAGTGTGRSGVTATLGGLQEWLAGIPVECLPALASAMVLARLAGSQPSTAGELAACLGGFGDAWWEEMATAAAHFEDVTRRVAAAARTALNLSEREKRLDAEVEDLRQQTKPFDENTDDAHLEVMWSAARAAEKQRDRVLAALETLRQRFEPLEAERQRLRNVVSSLRSELQTVLDPARGSTAQAAQLWAECQDRISRVSGRGREIEGILRGHQAATPGDLRQRAADAQLRALDALNKWQVLLVGHPELPPAEIAFDIESLARLQRQRQQEIQDLRAAVNAAGEEVERLRGRVAETKATQVTNVAGLAEELCERKRLVAGLEMEAASLGIAYNELDDARREYQIRYRDLLSSRATERFRRLSGVSSRRVLFGDDFETGVTDDGRAVALEQLSQGARDQLYLSIRLALADLLARDVELPFIFDDPFLTADEQRTERIREALLAIAVSRQVIVLSHRDEIASWGHRAEISTLV